MLFPASAVSLLVQDPTPLEPASEAEHGSLVESPRLTIAAVDPLGPGLGVPHRGIASLKAGTGEVRTVHGPNHIGLGGRGGDHGVMLEVVSSDIAGSDREG